MTELQLYKFIHDNNVEYHWQGEEVLCFIYSRLLRQFCEMLGHSIFDDTGLEVTLKQDYIAIEMVAVCEYFDCDPEQIFINNKQYKTNKL